MPKELVFDDRFRGLWQFFEFGMPASRKTFGYSLQNVSEQDLTERFLILDRKTVIAVHPRIPKTLLLRVIRTSNCAATMNIIILWRLSW